MTTRLVRIEVLAIAALSLAACTDNNRDIVAPKAPDKMIISPYPGTIPTLYQPAPTDFVQIAAGGNHTCARQYNGNVYCWGAEGEAGYTKIIMTPTLAFQGASQVAVGASHACALNGSGAVYCWGGGQWGQLGYQAGAQIGWGSGWVLPAQDPSGAPVPGVAYTSIYASGESTCGLTASATFCWGLEGSPMSPNLNGVPTEIMTPNNYSPVFSQLAIGNQHVCGLNYGEVECYGADQYGQAGEDPSTAIYFPGTKMVIVALASGITGGATGVAAQGDFTCANMNTGTVQCFGYNYDGELGNAPSSFTWTPQAVGGGKALKSVATGVYHACALDTNNEAWCWGYNYWGMVGNGMSSYSTSTVQKVNPVSTGFNTFGSTIKFRALAAGREHSCGIGTDNHIYCWGHNNNRQLGTWLVDANGNQLTYGWSPNPVLVM